MAKKKGSSPLLNQSNAEKAKIGWDFGIHCVRFLGCPRNARHFSGIGPSMVTLMQFVTVDSVAAIYFPIIINQPYLCSKLSKELFHESVLANQLERKHGESQPVLLRLVFSSDHRSDFYWSDELGDSSRPGAAWHFEKA